MCGIAGVISPSVVCQADSSVVMQMNQMLVHRGPDSEGVFSGQHVILAMRRLSIIDLAGGHQPIFNETGDIAIVCNGEIYNHRELRGELEALGHHFSSHSDVEVIVHAYEEYSNGCLSKLRGMFAFALWDGKSDKLLLARDRMGEKPLYLYHDEVGRLWFASELRSLSQAMIKKPRLTTEAFNLFLTFQYVPEPLTPLENIEVMAAGHYLELIPGQIGISPHPYWDLAQAHEDPSHPVVMAKKSLNEACRLMGTADVPVAIALSGGIDSSLVAAITSRYYPGQLHAFTVGYHGRPETDERGYAAGLAQELGIGFTEVELDTRDVIDCFPEMMAAMDTPIADIAAYGYYAVSRAARQAGYPVLLSGMGGDEFFWGYQWVRDALIRNEGLISGKASKRSWIQRLLRRAMSESQEFFGVHGDLRNGNVWSRSLMPADERAKLSPDLWLETTSLDLSQPMHLAVSNLLNRTWLRSNCLALADRMSMAHSVEVRLPLLDVDLVNRVTGMRNAGLDDWRKPHKWLLIEALRDVLPPDVLARNKQGFTPPVNDWMQGIVDRFRFLISDGALVRQGLIDPDQARGNLSEYSLFFLYKLVLLECWVRLHIEGQSLDELFAGKGRAWKATSCLVQ